MGAGVRYTRFFAALLAIAVLGLSESAPLAAPPDGMSKLDRVLQRRSRHGAGRSRVIIRTSDGLTLPRIGPAIQHAGGRLGRRCSNIASHAADRPDGARPRLA